MSDDIITQLVRQVNQLQKQVDGLIKPETGRWVDWTPVITQSSVVTGTITEAKYRLKENFVNIYCQLTVTGAGTAANAIIISGWPSTINPNPAPNTYPLGVGTIIDTGTTSYTAVVRVNSTADKASLFWPPTSGHVGANPSYAIANGDFIYFNMGWKL